MTLEAQADDLVRKAVDLLPGLPPEQAQPLDAAVIAVVDALNTPWNKAAGVSGRDCARYGTSSSWTDQGLYWAFDCDQWARRTQSALQGLAAQLDAIGEQGLSGVADAIADQVETTADVNQEVIPDTPGELWGDTPAPLRFAAGATVVYVLWRMTR